MALTTDEEAKVKLIIQAFDNAKQIGDLDLASMDTAGQYVELYDSLTGKASRMLLSDAVSQAGAEWCGIRYKDAKTETEVVGSLSMLRQLPTLLNLGGYLVQNDHSRRKLSPKTHLLLETGEEAVLDGSMGHYQWGWDKPFYFQNYKLAGYTYETMSFSKRKGFWNYYIPVGSRSAAGYAAYDSATQSLKSVGTATVPVFNKSILTLQTAAHKNGDLWFANERVMNFVTGMLKRLIFHNRSIQTDFNANLTTDGLHQGGTGCGCSESYPWDNGYLPLNALVEDGDALEVGSFKGSTTNKDGTAKDIEYSAIPNFYGLKNDYKALWCMSENMLINCNEDGSQSLYIDDSVGKTLFNLNSLDGHVLHSRAPYNTEGWKYPKAYNMSHLAFWPSEDGGSQSTYFGDGYYNPGSKSGLRGVGLLGGGSDGGVAGSMYAYGGDGVGGADVYWSAFLCEWAEAFSTNPVLAE